ncbi:unnamed protein product [Rhizoctonia solani]|uniref:Peptidase C14 caspase domain-containing protein n=1 Tax=Rhizoctonia solani TaxID=456999 RepID=A0A8H3B513_9AGAM|nr:unnamed protein product [Rhizoctonia solani]
MVRTLPQAPSPRQTQDGPSQNLHALIIGIDTYIDPSFVNLRGAARDANDVASFLMSDLGVPTEHIVNLRNEQATRGRILEELRKLWRNPNIRSGDPILIYYAGHGGLAPANKEWKKRYGAGKIQVIFPYDYGCKAQGPSSPVTVNCIPDKTIAAMLNKLSAEKGDNITVIFDSCHSASGNRGIKSGQQLSRDRRYRSAEVQFEIPHDIDNDPKVMDGAESMLPTKQHRDAQLMLHADQSSHVHFAACGVHQRAIEEDGQGLFTAELLKKMRQNRVKNITYHNLAKSLEMPDEQSPECYGRYKGRTLFNSLMFSQSAALIPAHRELEYDLWTLQAGDASGVTLGSTWKLHKSPAQDSESIGRFRVTDLYGSIATLEPLDSKKPLLGITDRQLYARSECHVPRDELMLKVWMTPADQKLLFPGPHQHMGSAHTCGIGYKMASTPDDADVTLEIHRPQLVKGLMSPAAAAEVIFYWHDETAKKYGTEKLKHRKSVNREEVELVLFAAAKWKWHLRRTYPRTDQTVVMNMLKVATKKGPRLPRVFLEKPEDVLVKDSVVDFTLESSALHGFKLQSNIKMPLYVRMFYFDTTDFSIGDMFGHSVGPGTIAANIPPKGELLIGDGADGGAPIRFNMSSTGPMELGYMKVFWSTDPLELDHIEQKSAFKLRHQDVRGSSVDENGCDSKWGTICLTLGQFD